jgi:hypothetical protein
LVKSSRAASHIRTCSEHEHKRDLAEMALGHAVGSAVEGAYARSDLLKLRRELMDAWSTYATGH